MWFHWSPIPLVCAHLTVSLTHRKLFNSSIFLNCIVLHILENVHHTYGFAPQPTALLISLHTHTHNHAATAAALPHCYRHWWWKWRSHGECERNTFYLHHKFYWLCAVEIWIDVIETTPCCRWPKQKKKNITPFRAAWKNSKFKLQM